MEGEGAVVALRIGFVGAEAAEVRAKLGMEESRHECVEVHYTPTGKVMLASSVSSKHLRNEGLLD
jgi:hypothetical protein